MSEEVLTVSKRRWQELLRIEAKMIAFEVVGVDNREGYDLATEEYKTQLQAMTDGQEADSL